MNKILGKSVATAEQMAKYLLSINKKPLFSRDITTLEFCQLFIDVCAKEGVRGDIAFAQSCKETGNFTYTGDVKYTQNNFAGLVKLLQLQLQLVNLVVVYIIHSID